ncbi:hypothetical protein [Pontibacillus yanchengensis]|uniref:Permease n=1 Tax=Pontibacillus yanchengensis Y32 TaxID=1385514 RepID=A0A0A2TD47_9BACI|nr:hypothetical protein [Pontibacillus yanchengensis]KGP73464.1 hypothetical protein N782_05110 [Pontibacillus yanchengensis Y32]
MKRPFGVIVISILYVVSFLALLLFSLPYTQTGTGGWILITVILVYVIIMISEYLNLKKRGFWMMIAFQSMYILLGLIVPLYRDYEQPIWIFVLSTLILIYTIMRKRYFLQKET